MLTKFEFTVYSDIHYDEYGFSGVDPQTKKNNRLMDIASADTQITEFAKFCRQESRQHFILFLGDRFRKRNPQGYIRDLADQEMRRRAQLGIPQAILPGNHDFYEKSQYKGTSYGVADIFKSELPGVMIMSAPRSYPTPYSDVIIHALPSGCVMSDSSFDIDKNQTNILVLHDLLSGSIIDERSGRTQVSSLSLSSIDLADFDFVLAGDVHIPQELKLKNTRGWYIGSTVQINRSEVGPRGWWKFYCDGEELKFDRFMPEVPMLQSFKGSLEESETWLENPTGELDGPLEDDYVWVAVVGNHSPKEKQEIRKDLNSKYGESGRLYLSFEPVVERTTKKMELKASTSPVDNWQKFVEKSETVGINPETLVDEGSKILLEASHAVI